MVALIVTEPDTIDEVIERLGDSDRLSWMHANFTDPREVPELGDAASYATRLYSYAGSGRDQVAWVVSKLRSDPLSRSATITTFQPLTDTSYIPCVSLLDFYLEGGVLELAVYAHSIDFGAKGYGNLVELAWIQSRVARELCVSVGRLTMIVKSAHVYDSESDFMTEALRKHFA
jgi:thymidylate synthase